MTYVVLFVKMNGFKLKLGIGAALKATFDCLSHLFKSVAIKAAFKKSFFRQLSKVQKYK